MAHEQYNGWTNRSTWAIALWLGNDQVTDALAREIVSDTMRHTGSIAIAGDNLKVWVSDMADEMHNQIISSASLFSDLLRYALDDADWREIAQAFKDEAEDDTENEDDTEDE